MLLMHLLAVMPLPLLHAPGDAAGWAAYVCADLPRQLRENLAQAGYRDAPTRRAAIAAAGKGASSARQLLRPHAHVCAGSGASTARR